MAERRPTSRLAHLAAHLTGSATSPPPKVLIANRGEIAIRIASACRDAGVFSLAVCSGADRNALHTRVADACAELAGDDLSCYLDGDQLLRIARKAGCTAVHPGYGFLSESAPFAEACAAAGVTFVGPHASALRTFGDKVLARELAESVGVPCVPGSNGAVASAEAALAVARHLGFPVMLKASQGGGGRGIRAVHAAEDLAAAFERCRSEATASFGEGAMFVERLVERPKHVEVQVLADRAGGCVHLHTRDCSVQLRHQKVLEIAPAHDLPADLETRLLADAVRLVKAARCSNASTVEFLVVPARRAGNQ